MAVLVLLMHGPAERHATVTYVNAFFVAVGFGISNTKQVAEVGSVASGVIIGSRLVRAVEEADDRDTAVEAVSTVVGESVDALRR